MMRVFFDSHPTLPGHASRGMGRYAQELEKALKENKNIQLVDEKEKADIVHYPYFDLFFLTLPLRKSTPVSVTVHDTHPLIYPAHFPVGVRGRIKFAVQKKRLQRVDAIIVNTETTKKDVVRFLDVPAKKVFVTHFAASKMYQKTNTTLLRRSVVKYNLPKKFVLYVGDVNYNKNVCGLISAFSFLKNTQHHLVLVGKGFTSDSAESRLIFQLVKELKIEKKVHVLGFVPDEDLVKIYNLAGVYCQPSFYEGFGFPVLEAMACGTPVVAGKTQALVEIGEGAAVFVDPKNAQALAAGLEKVISGEKLRKDLIAAGLKKAKEFSWDKTASSTVNVYKKILGQ